MLKIKRNELNPILIPDKKLSWESEATFNGCPARSGSKDFLIYRAEGGKSLIDGDSINMSTVGIAELSKSGRYLKHRQLISPEYDWEKYGCEDPRVTKLKKKNYIFYTALSGYPFNVDNIKVAVAITEDFKKIKEKHPVTPFNAKAMALFPDLFKGRYVALLTVNTDRPPSKICWAVFEKEEDIWSEEYWNEWYKHLDHFTLPLQRNKEDQVELGAPPIRTKDGWLLIYSYISDYFKKPVFGIEAVLLDLNDPRIIRGRSKHPMLMPEEEYEVYGRVPNITFPSGAEIDGKYLRIFYGAADTVCASAKVVLKDLLKELTDPPRPLPVFQRAEENPIIEPDPKTDWEAQLTFNPGVWSDGLRTHMLYRAMSIDNTSVFGYASSIDGINFTERLSRPVYGPREIFESKLTPNGNSGCEDPRLTLLGDKIFMCYTAYDGHNPPRIALTNIDKLDFQHHKWSWSKPILISPPGIDDKDAAIFPEKINGKYAILHRLNNGIDINFFDDLKFKDEKWLTENKIMYPRRSSWEGDKIGAASPPHRTKDGWLLLYHGVSDLDREYRVGAALLDLKDPQKVIARTDKPIFEPQAEYEKIGIVPNVVFPCGSVIKDETLYIYYGGADRVVGVATLPLKKLLNYLS